MKAIRKRIRLSRKRFSGSTIPRFNLSIANHQRTRAVDLRILRRIAKALLSEHLSITNCDFGICLIAAPEMTRLNETFVHHAGSTDVITFDYAGPVGDDVRSLNNPIGYRRPAIGHKTEPPHVSSSHGIRGEIFICVDEAVIQARRFRTSWQSEIIRYLIHGLLHLLGCDDQTIAARRQMKRVENRLLRQLSKQFPIARLARKIRHS